MRILLENGQRTGAIINSTKDQFDQAVREGAVYIMKVKKHKTYNPYTSCNLVLSKELYSDLYIWTTFIRSALIEKAGSSAKELFVNFNGKSLDASSHNGFLQKHVEDAFGATNINTTRIRKSLVVLVSMIYHIIIGLWLAVMGVFLKGSFRGAIVVFGVGVYVVGFLLW